MSQVSDVNLANQTAASLRAELNLILAAILSSHIGSSAPGSAAQGHMWVDNTATPWILKFYDGADWINLIEINASSNKVNFINMAGGDARDEAPHIGQIQDGSLIELGSVSGTNTITGALTPAITGYTEGMIISFKAAGANTGAATININSQGAKALQKNGQAFAGGELASGDEVLAIYDGTQFQVLSLLRVPYLADQAVAPAKIDQTEQALGSVSGATAIDLNNGRSISMTLSASTTLSFSNWLASGQADAAELIITTGASTPLAFSGITLEYDGGEAPSLPTSGKITLVLRTGDAGSNGILYVTGGDVS